MKYENLEKVSKLYNKISQVKCIIKNLEKEIYENNDKLKYISIEEEQIEMEEDFFKKILNIMLNYDEFLIKKLEEL